MTRLVSTRWSHLVGYSGVGALLRADNDLFVVQDISRWTDPNGEPAGEPLSYVDLLRGTLGLDHKELRQPPLARVVGRGRVDGSCVPALRFPGWSRCTGCGLLHYLPWRSRDDAADTPGGELTCECTKRGRLRQVDWVIAHPDGGLQDVPWHFLAHRQRGSGRPCREDRGQHYLRLLRDRLSGGWVLHCGRCNGPASAFNPRQALPVVRDTMRQPWQAGGGRGGSASDRGFVILEVNDPRLYLPRVDSGLVIPPESQVARNSPQDRLYRNHAARAALARCRTELARLSQLRSLADEFGCTPRELEAAWRDIDDGWPLYGQTATPGQLLEKEYRALSAPIPHQSDGEDLVTRHHSDAWRGLAPGFASGLASGRLPNGRDATRAAAVQRAVQCLVAVSRLREIRVFVGFSRVAQRFDDRIRPNSSFDSTEPAGRLVPPDLDGGESWLPAIEQYGEGIFLTLDEPLLRRWERQPGLRERVATLQRRLEQSRIRLACDPPTPLTPRFLLLHTLAHLLIRRLETEAGYPAASIRERIYCADGDDPMSGILVYVAVPDIAGSLGGLAELAEPTRFLRLLTAVFEHADWCSLDPVCAEHEGQGPSQLNRAACHACTLLPEPSCQFGNLLLDRVFVVGDLGGAVRPLLDFADGG